MAEEFDPEALARAVAIDTAEDADHVGAFVTSETSADGVTDFRFVATMVGYEGWQWSVTLFHDVDADRWTVDEASLIPTDKALLPPPWVPWKDRLEPSDLSVTDSIGTEPGDERLEPGVTETTIEQVEETHGAVDEDSERDAEHERQAQRTAQAEAETRLDDAAAVIEGVETVSEAVEDRPEAQSGADAADAQSQQAHRESSTTQQDLHDAIEEFDLSRRAVMSPFGRAQTAQRWYDGPHGPKSLSTKTANGNVCSTCGFFIPLRGDLSEMFGVCANRWSPDDGRVVSLDHGCGEHSQIEPPEPSRLWIQTKPAYDDVHIDIVAQSPREERGDVELIETVVDAKKHDHEAKRHDGEAPAGDDVPHEERRAAQDADVPMPDADAQRKAADEAIAGETDAGKPAQAPAQQIVDAADAIVDGEQRQVLADSAASDTIGRTQVVAELATDAENEGEDFDDALSAKAGADAGSPHDEADRKAADAGTSAESSDAEQPADAADDEHATDVEATVEPDVAETPDVAASEDDAQTEGAVQTETVKHAPVEVETADVSSDALQEETIEPYQEAHA